MTINTFGKGATLHTKRGGAPIEVREHLGTGGQGEVYRVDVDRGRTMAMKWYLPTAVSRQQYRRLQRLIDRGAPSPDFLWPEEMVVSSESKQGFGYLMELRPRGFFSIVELMAGRVNPSFRTVTTAAMNLANAFLSLHSRGLCYGDISFGNIFFHPRRGEIRICDNDNVIVDGSDDITVLGTPRFMAPEIVCGESLPNSDTDRYSLAVLLFYLFMVHHPLEGRREWEIHCLDLPAMERLYGDDPLFIFDPDDHSNRPMKGHQDAVKLYWELYPQFLRDLFTTAFTRGLRHPEEGRVRESQWSKAIGRLQDSIMNCECGAEVFYDVHYLRKSGGVSAPCWSCGQNPQLSPRMRIGDAIVVMTEETTLLKRHLCRFAKEPGQERPLAVCEHAGDGTLALVNKTSESWSVTTSGHSTRSIEPGKGIALRDGLEIHFGEVRGRVRM